MVTIFVAYGDHGGRESVLAFAAERAAASGDDLYVYHARKADDEPAEALREEVTAVIERTAPDVAYETVIDAPGVDSDRNNVSTQKRLLDAVVGSDREFAYVVMGNIRHGAVERFAVPSVSKAVLQSHDLPVVLVPV